MNYPETKMVDASDTYFGKTYKDPYRWLENIKDREVEAWFRAQAELTDDVLSKIPGRDALAEEWLALDRLQPPAYGMISYRNGRVFYKKTMGGENVGRLFVREGWEGEEKLLFEPTTCKSGVAATIQHMVPSWDGKHVVFGLSSGGAEHSEIRVLDIEAGTLLPESIYPSLLPLGWTRDDRAFFYDAGKITDLKSAELMLNRQTRLHQVNSDISADRDIFSNESYPELGIATEELAMAFIDECCPDYLLGVALTAQIEMRLFYAPAADVQKGRIRWKVLCNRSDRLVRGHAFDRDHVYAVTHAGASRYKVVRTSVKHPEWEHAETVIPEAADSIQQIARCKHYLFVVYSNGVVGRLVKYELSSGETKEIKLPASGTVNISCPDPQSDRCLIFITSWTAPVTIYDFDARTDSFAESILNTDVSYPGFEDLISEEVEVPGHDGTMVPLSIIYRKGTRFDGSNSCILEGYGAYGMSWSPYFNVMHSVAVRGVVLAFAHPRGGGEKGEAWHKAGHKATKPNTWKDFISCAEYLVKKGYTSPGKLGATGSSAGGVLISRAITERPDLFAAAVCNVGIANAMRLEFHACGPANVPEFGTVKDPVECEALFEMDGVHHLQEGMNYPAVIGVAGWNDPRVPTWQPGKFVATLQAVSASKKPVLMKVNYDGGHYTEAKTVMFRNYAGQFAFLLWQTGHEDFHPA
jgi:prolyl oligopeptidase